MQLLKDHVLADSTLDFRLNPQPVADWPAAQLVAWEVRNTGAQPFHGTLRLQVPFPEAFRLPWIMVPGFLYGDLLLPRRRVREVEERSAYGQKVQGLTLLCYALGDLNQAKERGALRARD